MANYIIYSYYSMDKAILEYVWIDAKSKLRSKIQINYIDQYKPIGKQLELWSCDGSSTGQKETSSDSEVYLQPVVYYKNPFYQTNILAYLILCESVNINREPLPSDTLSIARLMFEKIKYPKEVWFGFEQEYVMYKDGRLLGWPLEGEPEKQGKYYCGVGSDRTFGRQLVDEHLQYCLYAGINLCGINQEVLPGQWEYQIGICKGISGVYELWIARYIMERLSEKYNIVISYEPKPVEGDWNGSGLHTNFSTQNMRENYDYIIKAINSLEKYHNELITVCGDNTKRLKGTHETSKIDVFTFGVGDRTASVRIPKTTFNNKKGYIEYRVPASDADPALIVAKMLNSMIVDLEL